MRHSNARRTVARLVKGRVFVLLAAAVLVLTGCGSTQSASPTLPSASLVSGPPSHSMAASATPNLTPVPTSPGGPSSSPASSTPPTQTSIEWGRIWDALPAGFPLYPGSTLTDTGVPASAQFDVPAEVAAVTPWMKSALERAGFSTESVPGPLEDGSMVINSVGATEGCRVQTSIAPQGGVTIMTIFYGADCPFG